MHRISRGVVEDKYISPYDARLRKLMVQTTDEIYRHGSKTTTWDRTFIRNVVPYHLQTAYWPTNHIAIDEYELNWRKKAVIWLKWLPAMAALFVTVCFDNLVLPLAEANRRIDQLSWRRGGRSPEQRAL